MKKLFMIALAGMMMFAFTQCGSKGTTENKEDKKAEEKTEVTDEISKENQKIEDVDDAEEIDIASNETKQFRDSKAFLEKVSELVNGAKTCEEFEKVGELIGEMGEKLDNTVYDEGDEMTEEEEELIEEMAEDYLNLITKKYEELCLGDSEQPRDGYSKQFQDLKDALDTMTELVSNAQSCDDLEKLEEVAEELGNRLDNIDYDDEDLMTEEEEDLLEKLSDDFENFVYSKALELCGDDD